MRIALVLVYFGEWPIWFPAFLSSCKHNREIDWLIFTDCDIPDLPVENINFIPFSMPEFRELATRKLGFPVTHETPYKLCDFKPSFGLIFEDFLTGYDFWGHCDLDVIWGDIREFITDDILISYDIISARKEKMCGHFSLYRNTQPINKMFMLFRNYKEILTHGETVSFDEVFMSIVVEEVMKQGLIRVYWPRWVLDDEFATVLRRCTTGWHWEHGKLFNMNDKRQEIMYLHFSEWKQSLRNINFSDSDSPDSFEISNIGIISAQYS